MIISSETIQKDSEEYKLEIVNGEDIIKTYWDKRVISSCMSRSATLKFYSELCPSVSLLRIIKDDKVFLRSLIWNATLWEDKRRKIRFFDKLYYGGARNSSYDVYGDRPPWIITGGKTVYKEIFLPKWKEFVDVRETARPCFVKTTPIPPRKHTPYMDTMRFSNHSRNIFSNDPLNNKLCINHTQFGRGTCLFRDNPNSPYHHPK